MQNGGALKGINRMDLSQWLPTKSVTRTNYLPGVRHHAVYTHNGLTATEIYGVLLPYNLGTSYFLFSYPATMVDDNLYLLSPDDKKLENSSCSFPVPQVLSVVNSWQMPWQHILSCLAVAFSSAKSSTCIWAVPLHTAPPSLKAPPSIQTNPCASLSGSRLSWNAFPRYACFLFEGFLELLRRNLPSQDLQQHPEVRQPKHRLAQLTN